MKGAHFAHIFDLSADEESFKLKTALGAFGPKWFTFDPGSKKRLRRGLAEALPDNAKFYDETGVKSPSRLPDFRWALSRAQGFGEHAAVLVRRIGRFTVCCCRAAIPNAAGPPHTMLSSRGKWRSRA